jgi:hypothetical protein
VRMRSRKPCLRARRRLLGWKVRFTVHAPNLRGSVSHGPTTARHARTEAHGELALRRTDLRYAETAHRVKLGSHPPYGHDSSSRLPANPPPSQEVGTKSKSTRRPNDRILRDRLMYAVVLVSVAISTSNAATEPHQGLSEVSAAHKGPTGVADAAGSRPSTPVDDDVDGGVPGTGSAGDYSGSEM